MSNPGITNLVSAGGSAGMAPLATIAHRTITALDGQIYPLPANTDWETNPGGKTKARFFVDLVVRGTTGLADDPVITFRPYVRNGGTTGYVGAAESVSFTRPRLANLATIKLQKTVNDGVGYTDYSANIIDNGAGVATLSALDTVANGDWLVVGGPVPFMGTAMDMTVNVNGNASVLTAEYWTGAAWAALANVVDGTIIAAGMTFSGDGQITWDIPAGWTASTINALTAYWVRLSVSAALGAVVEVTEMDLLMPMKPGIDVQIDGDDAYLSMQSQDAAVTGTVGYTGTARVSFR